MAKTSLWHLSLFVLLVLSISSIDKVQSQRPCTTPDNRSGTCVNIDNCPQIAEILRNAPRPLPSRVQNYIVQLGCGMVNNKHGLCCQAPTLTVTGNTDPPTPSGDISSHRNIGLLPSTDCGPISTNKVAGGEQAGLGEFPWMALLRYNTPDGLRYLCGASIISSRYILTAAHCVSKLRSGYRLYSVIVGEQNTGTDPDCLEGVCNNERQEILVDQVIPHATYDTPRFANDIALIRLTQEIAFSGDYVKPVCLPTTDDLVNRTFGYLVVSGWGTTEDNSPSVELLKARLNVVPIQDCRTAHRQNQLTDDQVCAKGKGIIDTCKGDSGGPLVFPVQLSNTGRFVQFGIVSAGAKGCGELADSKPGIYVRVQRYMNWILDNMRS